MLKVRHSDAHLQTIRPILDVVNVTCRIKLNLASIKSRLDASANTHSAVLTQTCTLLLVAHYPGWPLGATWVDATLCKRLLLSPMTLASLTCGSIAYSMERNHWGTAHLKFVKEIVIHSHVDLYVLFAFSLGVLTP
jgi:hypothetical protein